MMKFVHATRVLVPIIGVAGWIGLSAEPARSASIPAAITLTSCAAPFQQTPTTDPSSCSVVDASASLTLSPSVSANANAVLPVLGSAASTVGQADLRYFFSVVGPTVGVSVPVLIDANLSVSAVAGLGTITQGLAAITVADAFDNALALVAICTNSSCGTIPGTSFDGTLAIHAISGQANQIKVLVQAIASSSTFPQSAIASADPFIHIDPSFGEANLYNIQVSPGVANAPLSPPPVAAPETSSLALTGLALAAIVIVRKRAGVASVPVLS